MRLRPAFTLVEILVAITILAIAATVVIPSVGQSQDWVRVPSAGRMVLADLLYAQNEAITRQKPVWIFVIQDNLNENCYAAASFSSGATTTAPNYAKATSTAAYAVTGGTGTMLISPVTQSPFCTQFGASPKATGPLASTKLKSVKLGTTAVTQFGFDALGQPLDNTGAAASAELAVEISNRQGASPITIKIQPISGEMTAQ